MKEDYHKFTLYEIGFIILYNYLDKDDKSSKIAEDKNLEKKRESK